MEQEGVTTRICLHRTPFHTMRARENVLGDRRFRRGSLNSKNAPRAYCAAASLKTGTEIAPEHLSA